MFSRWTQTIRTLKSSRASRYLTTPSSLLFTGKRRRSPEETDARDTIHRLTSELDKARKSNERLQTLADARRERIQELLMELEDLREENKRAPQRAGDAGGQSVSRTDKGKERAE
ncbi:hypothetical protein BDV93DRAFT_505501 [Ceratobasidium sp. AG-I]|nr:hypothetical protein BDV93DRAFT_505501 [Ceratobasidium sp. AG-I]